uniref:Uncharacterized protein n=1 Tax=Acidithiobacillus sulfuriphilus TaxID=1867749 RepID=A0A3M8QQW0_9PROT|nr:hypothetical protein EC580_12455 [Acidithiobacillus sulfuriphilus]
MGPSPALELCLQETIPAGIPSAAMGHCAHGGIGSIETHAKCHDRIANIFVNGRPMLLDNHLPLVSRQ